MQPSQPFLGVLLLSLMMIPTVQAAGPTPISDVAGKTGLIDLRLATRSPLSAPADVIKRMSLPAGPQVKDYDISKEPFAVYVPKSPAENGKYGLMVLLDFGGHGVPPAWYPVLEKHHVIFIGALNAGQGRPVQQRVGLMLDAVENARKAWPIEDARVYMFIADPEPPVGAVGFVYPEVFHGVFWSINWLWYAPLPDSQGRKWRATLPPPTAPELKLDKARTRFFLAERQRPPQGGMNYDELVEKEGFLRSGYKYAKMITVSEAKMGHYAYYAADWFDEGIQFLDAPIPELARAEKAAVAAPEPAESRPAPAALAQRPVATPPAASAAPSHASPSNPPAADDSEAKAESTLRLARSYIAAERYDSARTRLRQIIQTYPKTQAADQARSLLKEIENK